MTCVDCGRATGGKRCKVCNGREQARLALIATAASDRELLDMVDVQKVNANRIANRLGVSSPAVYERIKRARRREEARRS